MSVYFKFGRFGIYPLIAFRFVKKKKNIFTLSKYFRAGTSVCHDGGCDYFDMRDNFGKYLRSVSRLDFLSYQNNFVSLLWNRIQDEVMKHHSFSEQAHKIILI